MQSNEPAAGPALCVSIHDVAPATWDECARLAAAIREVADIPLSWLVVPHYHREGEPGGADRARMEAGLSEAQARGDELVLHGYTHLDTAARPTSWRERFLRGTYSREGEFAALSADEAQQRIRLGLDWFAERGWPVYGFVAPAWLLGEGAWQALRRFDFTYTTTYTRFYLLNDREARHALKRGEEPGFLNNGAEYELPSTPMSTEFSPSLVYAARNRSGRLLSPLMADLISVALARAPLIRLSLHPPDVRYPRLLRHAQRTVERLLKRRRPMTKAGFAQQLLTSTAPNSPASTDVRHNTVDPSVQSPRGY